jgi:hypothetical protein
LEKLGGHLMTSSHAVRRSTSPFSFRLKDYSLYLDKVGEATYLDVTRRTDLSRIEKVWDNLRAVVETYGTPWIVQLWTKDALGTLETGGALLRRLLKEGTTLTAQMTVTGLGGSEWEPLVHPQPFKSVPELIELVGGPNHLKWRYDPIMPTIHDLDRFRHLAEQAATLGITRCVINFISPPGRYKRVDARLAKVLPGWSEGMPSYDEAWRLETSAEIVEVCRNLGLFVAACAESARLSDKVQGLQPAVCGDYDWFVTLSGRDPGRSPSTGSRLGCGCAKYFDVGAYGQWKKCHQCLYCYAG